MKKLQKEEFLRIGGADGIRTHDLLVAIEERSQLRHGPTAGMPQAYHSKSEVRQQAPPCVRILGKSVELQGYGKTHISRRGRLRYRIEVPDRGGRKKTAGGLRALPGHQRAEGAQLQAAAGGTQDD